MNYIKAKLNECFGWFGDNRIKPEDIIDPRVLITMKEINYEVNKLIENLKKLRDEL